MATLSQENPGIPTSPCRTTPTRCSCTVSTTVTEQECSYLLWARGMGCSWLVGVIKQCGVRLWSTLPTVPEPWEIVPLHGRDTLPCLGCDRPGVVVAVIWYQTPGVERHHWGPAWHKEPHIRPGNGHDGLCDAPSAVLPCNSPMAVCVEAYEGAVSERPSNMLTEEYRRYPKSGQLRQGYGMSMPH